MSIEQMLEALAAPPLPANEVVSLDRRTVERALTLLESHQDLAQAGPSLCAEVCVIRQALAAPKVELWAMHSVGPGDVTPCMDKEDAERQAQELRDMGEKLKADRIEKGESVEFWCDWIINVIPSPWEPAEHFEIMAEEWQDSYEALAEAHKTLQTDHERVSNNRDMWKGQVERQAEELTKLRTERDELLDALVEARSVLSSINVGDQHKISIADNDGPVYWQRKEWIDWAMVEVLPIVESAIGNARSSS